MQQSSVWKGVDAALLSEVLGGNFAFTFAVHSAVLRADDSL